MRPIIGSLGPIRLGIVGIALVGVESAAVSAEPPVPVATSSPAVVPDVLLAARVKSALASDSELQGLNLFISVVDRVALVGGPVPDAAISERIGVVLRKLPGLVEVKVSCWVSAEDNPLAHRVADRLKPEPAAPLPLPASAPSSATPVTTLPMPPSASPEPVHTVGTVTVKRVSAPTPAGGYLLEPVAPGGRSVPTLAAPPVGYPTIPSPAVPTMPVSAEPPVVRLTAREARFAGLNVQTTNGIAVISGTVARDADAWDFADLVRTAPGVTRVVLGRISVRDR